MNQSLTNENVYDSGYLWCPDCDAGQTINGLERTKVIPLDDVRSAVEGLKQHLIANAEDYNEIKEITRITNYWFPVFSEQSEEVKK